MRTLTIQTADDLVVRWKARAHEIDLAVEKRADSSNHIARLLNDLDHERAQAYRVCAAELGAVVAVTMELEAAHHGDPEPVDFETKLLDWSQGRLP